MSYGSGATTFTSSSRTDDDTLSTWHIVAAAPDDPFLPYHGGTFHIVVSLPESYPAAPSVLHFSTPIYHINVSRDGRVCHSLLDRDYTQSLPLSELLPGVVTSLFTAPEPASPLNKELAALFYADEAENAKVEGSFTPRCDVGLSLAVVSLISCRRARRLRAE